MIDRHLQLEFCGSQLKYKMRLTTITTLLLAWLPFSTVTAIAQDDAQADPKPHTLKVQVLDEDNQPIEGALVSPHLIEHQRQGNYTFLNRDRGKRTDELGETEFVFPSDKKGPIKRGSIRVNHDSFVEQHQYANFNGEQECSVSIVLKRGIQVAASAIDRITKTPIVENIYVKTNQHLPIDWKLKTNGTLISPVIGKDQCSFRLVQIEDGKPKRFSKLVDITHGEKSRLLFRDLEMVDAVTVTGKLSDEVPRPVKYGMVMACVASIGKADSDLRSRIPTWCWKTYAIVNRDGTFTLEGIPADSVLQIHCQCKGWTNKPPPQDAVLREFPKEVNNNRTGTLPHLAQIGKQPTEITVPMHQMGSVTVKVADQNEQPIRRANGSIRVRPRFFYSWYTRTYRSAESSLRSLVRLRPKSSNYKKLPSSSTTVFSSLLRGAGISADWRPRDSYSSRTDRDGTMVIKGVPAGTRLVSVTSPSYKTGDNDGKSRERVVVKPDENVEVKLTLNRTDPKDGGEDD